MTTLKTFTILPILAFASCQLLDGKGGKAASQLSDTSKVAGVTTPKNLTGIVTGSFVAKLKDGIEETNATINDSVIFKITRGQLFVYENYSHNAWIADGRSAYIPPEQVIKVDTPYFKFNFSKWDFVKNRDYELTQTAQRTGLDLNSIIQKIRQKNADALKAFFSLSNKVDGAAAEEFQYDLWALINVWSDTELLEFTRSLNKINKKGFTNLLLDKAPLSDVTNYYQLYYPKTLKEIKAVD